MKRILGQNARFFCICVFFLSAVTIVSGCGSEKKSTNIQSEPVAVLLISDTPKFDFGLKTVDSVTDRAFRVSNIGAKLATEISGNFYLSLNFSFKDGAFPGTGGTCTATLDIKQECTVVISFTPKYAGVVESTLNISYFNGSTAITAAGPLLVGQGN